MECTTSFGEKLVEATKTNTSMRLRLGKVAKAANAKQERKEKEAIAKMVAVAINALRYSARAAARAGNLETARSRSATRAWLIEKDQKGDIEALRTYFIRGYKNHI